MVVARRSSPADIGTGTARSAAARLWQMPAKMADRMGRMELLAIPIGCDTMLLAGGLWKCTGREQWIDISGQRISDRGLRAEDYGGISAPTISAGAALENVLHQNSPSALTSFGSDIPSCYLYDYWHQKYDSDVITFCQLQDLV